MALVGESGSGKIGGQPGDHGHPAARRRRSPAARSCSPIRARPGSVVDIAQLAADGAADARRSAAASISIIFQEPMTSLSPLHTVGNQVGEALRLHRDVGAGEAQRADRRDAAPGRLSRSAAGAARPIRSSSPAACASAR